MNKTNMVPVPVDILMLLVVHTHGGRPLDQCFFCDNPPAGLAGVEEVHLMCMEHMRQGQAEFLEEYPTGIIKETYSLQGEDGTIQEVTKEEYQENEVQANAPGMIKEAEVFLGYL